MMCWSRLDSITDAVHRPSPFVRSEEGAKAQKKVWSELNAKLEKIQPGVVSNV